VAGVVVELGIVRFTRSSDTAATSRALIPFVVPDVWSEQGRPILTPGPAKPPGRFEAIDTTTTDERGIFQFRQVPRQATLLIRARPRAPYQETYSQMPFWLSTEAVKEVIVVLRGGP
jgi:hypothetical protein